MCCFRRYTHAHTELWGAADQAQQANMNAVVQACQIFGQCVFLGDDQREYILHLSSFSPSLSFSFSLLFSPPIPLSQGCSLDGCILMRPGSHLTGFRSGCNEGSRLLRERVNGRSREMDTLLPRLLSFPFFPSLSCNLSLCLPISLSLSRTERERAGETADPPIPERRLWSASPLLVRFVSLLRCSGRRRVSHSLTPHSPLPLLFFPLCPLLLFFLFSLLSSLSFLSSPLPSFTLSFPSL